jgi:hypothetical protein
LVSAGIFSHFPRFSESGCWMFQTCRGLREVRSHGDVILILWQVGSDCSCCFPIAEGQYPLLLKSPPIMEFHTFGGNKNEC